MNSEEQLRVIQVIDTFGMGGAETWLMEALRFWSSRGMGRMDFLVTSGNRGIFDEEAEKLGARIHYLKYGRGYLKSFAAKFREILREGRYQAIHDHQDYASGWHFFLGRDVLPNMRITHVHNPAYQIRHNYGVTFARRLTARIGQRFVSRYATHIAGTSRQAIDEYGFNKRAFREKKRGVLHCGFKTERFLANAEAAKKALCQELRWPDDARIILYAGRIDQSAEIGHARNHKHSAFAIDVAIAAARREAKTHMLLAGKPSPAVPILQSRVEEAGLSGRIVFAGIRRDIEHLMAASDLLLFPSRGEGLGMVAVEAQAAGLPVLMSTAVPRESIVIDDLAHRKSVDEGAENWASDALKILDANRMKTKAANAMVSRSPFSIEQSAEALRNLYLEGRLDRN